jgi:tripartite-type tricarboxylate transporter receptor subunit TctC
MKGQKRKSVISWKVFICTTILVIVLGNPCIGAEDPAKFPSKPITMIIQWGAGGAADTTGRKIADLAGKILGQPILGVNKSGGGGVIGTTAVAKATPDGYTIGVATFSPVVFVPLVRSVPYNAKEDFTWIMQYGNVAMTFCVKADSRWKTFKDFLEEARQKPGKLNYGGTAKSGQYYFMEYLFFEEKAKVNFVPVRGGAALATSLLGGHVNAGIASMVPHIRKGGLRALAVQGNKRLAALPDVPSFGELGFELESPLWIGFYAPKGLDPRIVKKLGNALKKAYEDPSFKKLCATWNLTPHFRDSQSFKAKVLGDIGTQQKILKELGFVK